MLHTSTNQKSGWTDETIDALYSAAKSMKSGAQLAKNIPQNFTDKGPAAFEAVGNLLVKLAKIYSNVEFRQFVYSGCLSRPVELSDTDVSLIQGGVIQEALRLSAPRPADPGANYWGNGYRQYCG